mmetsp:Transcript_56397/g.183214  ORF Transcript_56397/g.183214 Transcript_56397/m.183214 type:complete len:266 (+) Transcript_56397:423-1220(+)
MPARSDVRQLRFGCSWQRKVPCVPRLHYQHHAWRVFRRLCRVGDLSARPHRQSWGLRLSEHVRPCQLLHVVRLHVGCHLHSFTFHPSPVIPSTGPLRAYSWSLDGICALVPRDHAGLRERARGHGDFVQPTGLAEARTLLLQVVDADACRTLLSRAVLHPLLLVVFRGEALVSMLAVRLHTRHLPHECAGRPPAAPPPRLHRRGASTSFGASVLDARGHDPTVVRLRRCVLPHGRTASSASSVSLSRQDRHLVLASGACGLHVLC